MPTLRYGAKGPEVRTLQIQLNKVGADIAVDGSFGPATSRAVSDFQYQYGLDDDSVAGPHTMKKLEQVINERIGVALRKCVNAIATLPEFEALNKLL